MYKKFNNESKINGQNVCNFFDFFDKRIFFVIIIFLIFNYMVDNQIIGYFSLFYMQMGERNKV